MQYFLELSYDRREDGAPITLIAALPTIRRISIGGAPGDLRLPGVAPDAVYAQLAFSFDHFTIDASGDEPVLVNDTRIDESGVVLSDNDSIRIGAYAMTFHVGELNPEIPLIDTPLRWKLRRPEPGQASAWFGAESPSRPYIEEFQTMIRPMAHTSTAGEIQKAAENEIRRVVRSDESEA